MDNNKQARTRVVKRRRKKRLRKRAYFILIPALVLFIALGYFTYLYTKADSVFSDSYQDDGREKSDLRETKVDPTEDNVSVLIMGVDENEHRGNEGSSRTDALMVATLNKEDKSVKLLSIPRDSYVYIPEVGYETKINHAHAYGGPQASIDTVENLLEIPIDYYVKVNFHAFVDVVDALGGITAEVPYELTESNSMDKKGSIHLMPGEQELNGEEALALARTRKLDNDIERGKRQQDLIKAVVNKAASAGSVLKYDDVIEAVGDNMTTNMSFDHMKSFISYGTSGSKLDIETLTLQGHDYQPGGTYYWQLDQAALEETKTLLQQHLEITNPNSTVNEDAEDGTAQSAEANTSSSPN